MRNKERRKRRVKPVKVVDRRKEKKVIVPDESWIPVNVVNTLMNIIWEGEPVGDIEVGSDGFVQAVWQWNGLHFRLEVSPYTAEARLRVWD